MIGFDFKNLKSFRISDLIASAALDALPHSRL
jgi:hypothetical protein